MYKPWRNDSFHLRNYGEGFRYRDFAKLYKAELYNPTDWANIIEQSGAKYAILTTKHSDGYCMWPTTDLVSKNWNCGETGPKRDLYGELVNELRKKSMRVGAYYSWLEYENMDSTTWPHTPGLENERMGYYIPKDTFDKYTVGDKAYIDHCHYQFKELVTNYQPDIVWADATWDRPASYWRSPEIVAWILNNAPNREDIVINDRWDNTDKKHGGYVTTEYGSGIESIEAGRPWEECQGIGYSFGLNRLEGPEQYKTSRQIVHLLAQTVSHGGNLLLNIGPDADGTIPVIQQERLLQVGRWLKINGEAIYGTRPYHNKLTSTDAQNIFFTYKSGALYVIATRFPDKAINIEGIKFSAETKVTMLGATAPVKHIRKGQNLSILSPLLNPDMYQEAYVFKVENVSGE